MTQSSSRMMDEFAKLMNDAAGVAQGVRREAESMFRTQAERFLADMDLVQREEFDVVKEMAAKARAENESLQAELAKLSAKIAKLEAVGKKPSSASRAKAAAAPSARKPAAKKES